MIWNSFLLIALLIAEPGLALAVSPTPPQPRPRFADAIKIAFDLSQAKLVNAQQAHIDNSAQVIKMMCAGHQPVIRLDYFVQTRTDYELIGKRIEELRDIALKTFGTRARFTSINAATGDARETDSSQEDTVLLSIDC